MEGCLSLPKNPDWLTLLNLYEIVVADNKPQETSRENLVFCLLDNKVKTTGSIFHLGQFSGYYRMLLTTW